MLNVFRPVPKTRNKSSLMEVNPITFLKRPSIIQTLPSSSIVRNPTTSLNHLLFCSQTYLPSFHIVLEIWKLFYSHKVLRHSGFNFHQNHDNYLVHLTNSPTLYRLQSLCKSFTQNWSAPFPQILSLFLLSAYLYRRSNSKHHSLQDSSSIAWLFICLILGLDMEPNLTLNV